MTANAAFGNGGDGITVASSQNDIVTGNLSFGNAGGGITSGYGNNNIIASNRAFSNTTGMSVSQEPNDTLYPTRFITIAGPASPFITRPITICWR